MLRELRAADSERVIAFLLSEFPQEEALLGSRPEEFRKIIRKTFQWNYRLLMGFAAAIGRPFVRFLVVEADGKIVGTTLVSFPPRAGYLSMVVVDPAYRGRGFARKLLERAREVTVKRGRPYCVLDVLDSNAPARKLYDTSGYLKLRGVGFYVHEAPAALLPFTPPPAVRRFEPRDVEPILAISRQVTPAKVQEVLPTSKQALRPPAFVGRLFGTEEAAWVVDRGHGPEGFVDASVSPATEAAHLSNPILSSSLPPDLGVALVRTATAWAAERKAPRVVSQVPEEPAANRAAVEAVGFRHAIAISTLYRPIG